ncbi:S-adenosyl-L-methionine-dependent methyltransferase [Stereum hirsutum FP-91666 SS1]|uniref:S-adenosyl-L-methionine-dependent methyltransferase n=1 Tax=Stereum hirsutum (strain FP-91666) TaxID=721885 RepID=UPI0004409EF9|nr:S-adenosyl-L-methionine-dependent methyltransferase [Stereum hirsutum FP-91666 SS1]EIM87652.1 S-adenosyl-L-methionine-dependent methyltransferase [Stereum hirsutum FP-91666 SS1]
MQNPKFEAYYKAQKIIQRADDDGAGREEWTQFIERLREPLPTTFRIAGTRLTAQVLKDAIENAYVPQLGSVVFEGQPVAPPVSLSWYPHGLAWQLNVEKKVLRKSPEFKKFHSFLVFETEVGNISRQEAVSMLPPLFLDVQPYHKVLDMCAAPGSKTAQLLEALHSSPDPSSACVPPGLLVANDSDYKRTHLLIHQSARLPSPAFIVTNADASIFPIIRLPHGFDSNSDLAPKISGKEKEGSTLLFDRILCDVPCSGDGTMRKNVAIWKHWNPMDGNGLHSLQLRILQRAMRMLHPDGRLVYSTCSLNPVENEAVVAEALRANPDFELVDVSDSLPTLIRRPGLQTWTPTTDKNLKFFETYEAYVESLDGNKSVQRVGRSHWPPTEGVAELHLERCMRIYPHLQDTGGFFVAVLQKKKSETPTSTTSEGGEKKKRTKEGKRVAEEAIGVVEESAEAPEAKKAKIEDSARAAAYEPAHAVLPSVAPISPMDEDDITTQTPNSPADHTPALSTGEPSKSVDQATERKGKRGTGDNGFKEMPYNFIPHDDPIVLGCIRQLSLTPDFPSSNILVRNPAGEPARSLYLTNDIVHAVVQHNDFKKMRLMNAGTKIFTKQEGGFGRGKQAALSGSASTAPDVAMPDDLAVAETGAAEPEAIVTPFRLLSEGLPVVVPYIREESIIEAQMGALRTLVEEYYPLLDRFGEPFKSLMSSKTMGSHVVLFKKGTEDDGGANLPHDLVLPVWKSAASVSLMIDKKAKSALSLRVFHEDITFAGREAAAKLKAKQASAAPSGVATPTTANVVQEKEESMAIEAVEKTETTVAMNEAP